MSIEAHTHGKFVWFELVTSARDKAKAYYTELFGWKATDEQMGPMTYTMLKVGDTAIGGIAEPPAGQDIPPHWNNYVTVPDVAAYIKKAEAAGGRLLSGPTDIPGGGTFATIADSRGATITLWRSEKANTEPEKERPDVGETCWFELMTDDLDQSKSFYTEIFNWTWEKGPMPDREYWIAKRGDRQTCGLMALPEEAKKAGAPPHWIGYVLVEDLEKTNAQAQKMGGSSLFGPQTIPTIGSFSFFKGPEGAVLAHFQGEQ